MEVSWAPGGRAATSETATEPSGLRNHSRCVSASRTPRAWSAAGPIWWMPAYSGPETSRGSTTVHWIQGFRRTSSGGGW